MNTTDTTTATPFVKGDEVVVTLLDGSTLTGTFVSINSKGVNINVDGKIVTRAMSRVSSVTAPEAEDEDTEGMTTAELADMFEVTARALRVRLRKLGMGVGKGRRYALTDADLAAIRASVEGEPIED